jgi:hypothetical protein
LGTHASLICEEQTQKDEEIECVTKQEKQTTKSLRLHTRIMNWAKKHPFLALLLGACIVEGAYVYMYKGRSLSGRLYRLIRGKKSLPEAKNIGKDEWDNIIKDHIDEQTGMVGKAITIEEPSTILCYFDQNQHRFFYGHKDDPFRVNDCETTHVYIDDISGFILNLKNETIQVTVFDNKGNPCIISATKAFNNAGDRYIWRATSDMVRQ